MQHLASSGNQLWALQWHSFLPAGLSAGSWGRAASCLTWRAPSGGLSGAEFPSSLCHLLFPWLVPSLFCRWGRQIAPIPDSCFLHGFCSLNVSLSFHILFFSLPILSLKQTFFFSVFSLPGALVALTTSPNGCGSFCFLQNALYTLLFLCVAFLTPVLEYLLSFLLCFLFDLSLARRKDIAIMTPLTWLAELITGSRVASISKWAVSWACSPVKSSSRWKAAGFQGVSLPLVLWSCVQTGRAQRNVPNSCSLCSCSLPWSKTSSNSGKS